MAAALDQIEPRVLKECAKEIAPIFTILFNKSITRGAIPFDWSQAYVTPIFRKGEKYKVANYRPVSPICITCKVLEHIVVSNILDQIVEFDIVVDNQHGFRARQSCETKLIGFIHNLASSIQRCQVDVGK